MNKESKFREIVAIIPKNKQFEIQLALEKYCGQMYIDIRVYGLGDSKFATRQGVKFDPTHIEQFRSGLKKAGKHFRSIKREGR